MAKEVKRAKVEVKEEDDKTVIYMVVGFCLGAIIALIFFEYYWVGVGGGTGMILGILASTFVDYSKRKKKEVAKPKKAAPKKRAKKK